MSSPSKIYNGLNFTLYCNIILSTEVKVVLQSVKISVNLTGPASYRMIPEVQPLEESSLKYSTSDTINSSDSLRTGNYTCTAKVLTIDSSSYLVTSSSISATTEIAISMILCMLCLQLMLFAVLH